jgi:hypothetical protein
MCAGLDQELVRSEAGLTVIWLCCGFLCSCQIVAGSCLEYGRDLCVSGGCGS